MKRWSPAERQLRSTSSQFHYVLKISKVSVYIGTHIKSDSNISNKRWHTAVCQVAAALLRSPLSLALLASVGAAADEAHISTIERITASHAEYSYLTQHKGFHVLRLRV